MIETRTVVTIALSARRSNHPARSYPLARSHPQKNVTNTYAVCADADDDG